MKNNVRGIVNAVVQGLIAHVYSISASLWYCWLIRSPRFGTFLHSLHLTCCTAYKWIFSVTISTGMKSESLAFCVKPLILTIILNISTLVVVVHYHLVLLPVALAWRINNGTCVLKHRYKIWHNYSLREEVFGSTKKIRALPLPSRLLLVVINAVRGPYRNMSVKESVRHKEGFRLVHYPRLSTIVNVSPYCRNPVIIGLCASYKLFDRQSGTLYCKIVTAVWLWQRTGKLLIVELNRLCCKVLRGKSWTNNKSKLFFRVVYIKRLHIRLSRIRHVLSLVLQDIILQQHTYFLFR